MYVVNFIQSTQRLSVCLLLVYYPAGYYIAFTPLRTQRCVILIHAVLTSVGYLSCAIGIDRIIITNGNEKINM